MIQVSHLTKKYGDFVAVDDISFTVQQGEVFAFLGPNGAGKSTTFKMLTTLLRPTSGTMSLNNIDPVSDPEQARRTFGIVFQDPVPAAQPAVKEAVFNITADLLAADEEPIQFGVVNRGPVGARIDGDLPPGLGKQLQGGFLEAAFRQA